MRGSLLRSNVYAVIKKRRQDATARFNERLEKLCENPEFNDAYLAERSAELALVRAKHMDKGVKQATDELARVQGATDKVLKKLGLTRDDLTVNYFCPQCSDTGVSKSSMVTAYAPLLRLTMSEMLMFSRATQEVN